MRHDFRTFRVSRIEDLVVRDETTRPRPGFNLQAYWEQSRRQYEEQMMPFALVLRVAPSARQRSWNALGTVLGEESDGSLVVRIDTESAQAALAYALSLGADATVLEPPEVREAVAAAARSIARLYAD
jgi:predicted DNA-binding transcriptional regulator YafY